MTTEHIKTRRKLKDIASIQTFNDLLNACTISEQDKEMLRLHYIEGMSFQDIGLKLGFSDETVRKHHSKAIRKISKMF